MLHRLFPSIFRFVLYAVAGFLVATAVAVAGERWRGCLTLEGVFHESSRPASFNAVLVASSKCSTTLFRFAPDNFVISPVVQGAPELHALPAWAASHQIPNLVEIECASGWPLRMMPWCMDGMMGQVPGISGGFSTPGDREICINGKRFFMMGMGTWVIPTRFLIPPTLVDALVWGFVCAGFFTAIGMLWRKLRRRIRQTYGACANCGYPIGSGGFSTCPECGAAQNAQSAT